jgi:hypothetical protein
MMNYIAILTFQIMFNIFKVLEIKFTYENQLTRLMLNSVWINLVSLASVYYSLDSLLKGDMWVLPFYIGGSVLGKWIAMTQMENLESKLFSFFKSKEDGKRNTRVRPK